MAYTDQATLARDVTFRDRVTVAYLNAATTIAGEAQASQDDVVYAKRQGLAGEILRNPLDWVDEFTWGLLSFDTTITAAITDAQLQTKVNAAFNKLAKITAKD